MCCELKPVKNLSCNTSIKQNIKIVKMKKDKDGNIKIKIGRKWVDAILEGNKLIWYS